MPACAILKRLQLTDDYRKRQAEAFVLSFAEEKNENELTLLVKKALGMSQR